VRNFCEFANFGQNRKNIKLPIRKSLFPRKIDFFSYSILPEKNYFPTVPHKSNKNFFQLQGIWEKAANDDENVPRQKIFPDNLFR